MCQGNGEVIATHPFCVILQKDRLYFKGTDRAVFLDKDFTSVKSFLFYDIVCLMYALI